LQKSCVKLQFFYSCKPPSTVFLLFAGSHVTECAKGAQKIVMKLSKTLVINTIQLIKKYFDLSRKTLLGQELQEMQQGELPHFNN